MYQEFIQEYHFLIRSLVDIGLATFVIYRCLLLIRGTRLGAMIVGFLPVLLLYLGAKEAGLLTISWMMSSLIDSSLLLIVVLFQEEIRKGLTRFGATSMVFQANAWFRQSEGADLDQVIKSISLATTKLARARLGALIVVERDVSLENLVEETVVLDAQLSRKLLYGIFLKDSPLHDGAVLIVRGRIRSAGGVLPLSYSENLDPSLGTRHRAALGLSEKCDALIVVVSEENSSVSLAREGTLYRNLSQEDLEREMRESLLVGKEHAEEEDA